MVVGGADSLVAGDTSVSSVVWNSIALFVLLLWCFVFPAKGALYQGALYLFPLIVFFNKQLRTRFIDLWKTHGWVLFVLLLLPLVISDFVNLFSEPNSQIDLRFDLIFLWRSLLFPIATVVVLRACQIETKVVYRILASMAAFYALAGLLEFIFRSGPILGMVWSGRMKGLVFNPNPFGLLMVFGILLAVGIVDSETSKIEYLLLLTAAILMLYCCILSGSRGAWLALISGVLVQVVAKRSCSWKIVTFLFVLLASIVGIVLQTDLNFSKLFNRFNSISDDSARFAIWSHYIDLIKQKIWFGYGSAPLHFSVFKGRIMSGGVHNVYLEAIYRTGVVGITSFLVFIGLVFRKTYRYREYSIFLSLVCAFSISALFDYSMYDSAIYQSFHSILIVFFILVGKDI